MKNIIKLIKYIHNVLALFCIINYHVKSKAQYALQIVLAFWRVHFAKHYDL